MRLKFKATFSAEMFKNICIIIFKEHNYFLLYRKKSKSSKESNLPDEETEKKESPKSTSFFSKVAEKLFGPKHDLKNKNRLE